MISRKIQGWWAKRFVSCPAKPAALAGDQIPSLRQQFGVANSRENIDCLAIRLKKFANGFVTVDPLHGLTQQLRNCQNFQVGEDALRV